MDIEYLGVLGYRYKIFHTSGNHEFSDLFVTKEEAISVANKKRKHPKTIKIGNKIINHPTSGKIPENPFVVEIVFENGDIKDLW